MPLSCIQSHRLSCQPVTAPAPSTQVLFLDTLHGGLVAPFPTRALRQVPSSMLDMRKWVVNPRGKTEQGLSWACMGRREDVSRGGARSWAELPRTQKGLGHIHRVSLN